ncbi:DUF2017 domain-containing protein [Zhihengliuella flava]|uniref:DUF2017 domain-containing protein n=1 Tax=Zhihengliuella flava TaxID=1285193 RepID=A0A931D746_9MICC|nr:DUF2017 domain-containing protein [Zhihengliuella flava]MBG6083617.1 hypothetical protein [Zhihengliuella flava]
MARAFRSSPRGIIGRLEKSERDLLRNLFDDVILMLEPDDAAASTHESPDAERDPLWDLTGLSPEDFVLDQPAREPEPKHPPQDPALLRLLPDAVRGDDAAAAAYRGISEDGVRQRKLDALRGAQLLLEGAQLEMGEADAQRLAAALNDVRLVLAERLHIESEADALRIHELQEWAEADTVEDYLSLVYNFVSWVQESLMQALLDTLRQR